ncbi:hypothetical protein [Dethiothermospora halolimnae]|uniref:hypothetical protein n=1 Tax=Dethiothermospora halolimnae TaxID=3114390 RepID=UPI003CCBFD64
MARYHHSKIKECPICKSRDLGIVLTFYQYRTKNRLRNVKFCKNCLVEITMEENEPLILKPISVMREVKAEC